MDRTACALVFLVFCAVRLQAVEPITAAAVAIDGNHVVLGSQRGIEVCTWPGLMLVETLATELEHIHDLKFAPDGNLLLAAGGSPAEIGRVEIWDWSQRKRISEVNEHDDVVYRVAWSPDGRQWVMCSGDGRCLVYSTATCQLQAQYTGHSQAILAICFVNHSTVASAGIDQTVRLWNTSDGSHLRTLDNHVGPINDIALRPKVAKPSAEHSIEAIATISEDHTVRLWQPQIGRLVRFAKLVSVPRSLVWSNDAMNLYVGCNDGRLRVIDTESMEVRDEFVGQVGRIHEMALLPAGELLLMAGEKGFHAISLRK